ncbi:MULTISPECIES: YadA-like family protein [Luteimonas]|uniref:YadA-like family protein n=1 Tax=Luteimonas TaxID=83614 RepID=UPI000C7C2602|nr:MULTISPECIES: YadA-like family protein [Luteimonas]
MNRVFRKVWNRTLGIVVVASELAKQGGVAAVCGDRRRVPVLTALAVGLLCAAPVFGQTAAGADAADGDAVAEAVERHLQELDDNAQDRTSSLLFSSSLMSAEFQPRSTAGGGMVAPTGVINPGGLTGGTLPGLVNYLQQFLVGGNYQQCGLLGNGQLLPTECLTISRANFRYAFTGVNLLGVDLLTLPNVADLNGNRPSDHTTILGRASSESYLTVTNAQYGAQNNTPTCTIAGIVGVCVPGVSTYTWSTLPAQDFQIIVGDGAAANGSNTVVMGTNATHRLPSTAWTGTGAPDGNYAARLGNAVVVGHGANGTADRQVILGANASSTHVNSVALGANATTGRGALTGYTAPGLAATRSSVGSVSIGSGASTRQLTNVAAGTQATDAVNVEQMQGLVAEVNEGNALAVAYDTADRDTITLDPGGTIIANLAPGAITAGSTQAVNGAQLFGVAESVAGGLGGGAAVAADGTVTAPTYVLQDGAVTASDVGTAFANVDARTTTNTTDITNLTNGTAGLVQQDADTLAITVAGATGGTTVDFTNSGGGARTLDGVAGGLVASGSNQAVNGAQLFSANAAIASHLGGGAVANADGAVSAPSYSIAGTSYDSAGTAFAAIDGALADAAETALFAVEYDTDAGGAPDLGRITLGAPGTPTTIGNLAAGVAADEAVNVGQLAPVVAGLGGGAAIDPTTGAVTGPTYTLDDGTGAAVAFDTVGGALTNLDGRTSDNTTNITTLLAGTAGLVQQADATAPVTVAAATGGDVVDFGNVDGDSRVLDGVAAGTVTAGSTQAINGGQLAGVAGSVATHLGGGATVAADGAVTAPAYDIRGASFDNVGAAFAAVDTAFDAVGEGVDELAELAVRYDTDAGGDPDFTRISLQGAGGTAVGNVAAGVAADEAVNVGQLAPVVSGLGGGAAIDPTTGAVTGPTYTLDDGFGAPEDFDNVGGALANLDVRTSDNTTNVNALLAGTAGLVQQDAASLVIRVGGQTLGTEVDISDAVGDGRRLAGVADATEATDAVNLGQLAAVGGSVATHLGGGATVAVDGTVTAPAYDIRGASFDNVGAAFAAVDTAFDAVGEGVDELAELAVRYDTDAGGDPDFTRISLQGTGGTTIGNVAAGVAADEAVNVGQLAPVVAGLGGGAAIDPTSGAVTGPTYTLDSGANTGATLQYDNVGAALGNLDARVVSNTALIVGLDDSGASSYLRVNSTGAAAQAIGADSVALGQNAIANGDGGVAIGLNAVTGDAADPTRINEVAIGNNARATAQNSTAVGGGAIASGPQSTALGSNAQATGSNSLAVGRGAVAGSIGTAVGMNANAAGTRATALGQGAQAAGTDSTALGQFASASGANSVALGLGSLADRDNAVSVGTAAGLRQVINVGDGTADTDAVNLRQLTAVEAQIDDLDALAVQYDDATQTRLTLAGAGGTVLANVAAGVAADEAVNVGQLAPVVESLGGGAAIDPVTGAVTGPTYTLDDGSGTPVDVDTVGDAVANLDGRTSGNTTSINNLLAGTAGLVRQDPATEVLTVGAQTGGTQVGFANDAGAARRLTGVATGIDDTDAVNVVQLRDAIVDVNGDSVFAVRYADDGAGNPDYARIDLAGAAGTTLGNVAAGIAADEAVNVGQISPLIDALGGGAGLDPGTGAVNGPSYELDGGAVVATDVGTAVTNLDGRTTANTTNITNNTTDITNLLDGTAGLVQQDPGTLVVTVAGESGGDEVSLANVAGDARRLSGVADGIEDDDAANIAQLRAVEGQVGELDTLGVRYDAADRSTITLGGAGGTTLDNLAAGQVAAGSMQAINGGQMHASLSSVASILGGGASVDAVGGLVSPEYGIQGALYTTIGSALSALDTGLSQANTRIDNLAVGGGVEDPLVAVDGDRDGSDDATAMRGSRGVAIGSDATKNGEYGIAVGGDSYAAGDHDIAIGGNARVYADFSTALGTNTVVTENANEAVVVGESAVVAEAGGTALGQGASVTAEGAVALGQDSVADRAQTVSVGSAGSERQIVNVAAGTEDTDAVNVSQLRATEQGTVRYDTNPDGSPDTTQITLNQGGGAVSLRNVRAGVNGTDAVNVAQMNAGIERAVQSANDYTDMRLGQMQSDVWEIDRGYRAGVASAMAVAGLPQAYQPGRSMVAAAVSGYEREAGLAVGITTISESGRWVYKFSGTTNTLNDVGVTVGAGMQW